MSDLFMADQVFPNEYVEYCKSDGFDWIMIKPVDQEVIGFAKFKWYIIRTDTAIILRVREEYKANPGYHEDHT